MPCTVCHRLHCTVGGKAMVILPVKVLCSTELSYIMYYCSGAALLHCIRLHFSNLHLNCRAYPRTAPYSTELHWTCDALHCTALHWTTLNYTELYCSALYHTALPCTEKHCTVMQFTRDYWTWCTTPYCSPNRNINKLAYLHLQYAKVWFCVLSSLWCLY